jgi:hypothetical protein
MIMPEVRVETTVDIDEWVDVDIEDVLDDCSELEIQAVIRWLKEGDYLVKEKIVEPHDLSFSEEQFNARIQKLSELYFTITSEDLDALDEILKNY